MSPWNTPLRILIAKADHCSWHLATNAIDPPPSLAFRMAKCLPDDSKLTWTKFETPFTPPLLPCTSSSYSSYLMSRGGLCGSRACLLSELELGKFFSQWLRAIRQHQAKRSQVDYCITNCRLCRKAREPGNHFKSPKRRLHSHLPKKRLRSHRHRRSTTAALNRSQPNCQHMTTVSIEQFVQIDAEIRPSKATPKFY